MITKAAEKAAGGDLALPGASYWRQRAAGLRASAAAREAGLPWGGRAFLAGLAEIRAEREQALFFDFLADNSERRGE